MLRAQILLIAALTSTHVGSAGLDRLGPGNNTPPLALALPHNTSTHLSQRLLPLPRGQSSRVPGYLAIRKARIQELLRQLHASTTRPQQTSSTRAPSTSTASRGNGFLRDLLNASALISELVLRSSFNTSLPHPPLLGKGLMLYPFRVEDELQRWRKAVHADRCAVDWQTTARRQLANWAAKGINIRNLDVYCDVKGVVFAQLVGGELRYAFYQNLAATTANTLYIRARPAGALWLIALAARRAAERGRAMPDVELALFAQDGSFPRYRGGQYLPMFGSVKCPYDARHNESVSFPMIIQDQFGFVDGRTSLSVYQQLYERLADIGRAPWNRKIRKLFFSAKRDAQRRGNRDNIYALQRQPLYAIYNASMPLEQNGRFKYLVYAHGNLGWSRRLRELAFMNATVLAPSTSQCQEYFLDRLQPGVHFEPVADDYADLQARLAALLLDDTRAERMADAWVRQGLEIFTLTCTLDYVEALLREYAALLRVRPRLRLDWQLFSFSAAAAGTLFDAPGPIGGMCNQTIGL